MTPVNERAPVSLVEPSRSTTGVQAIGHLLQLGLKTETLAGICL